MSTGPLEGPGRYVCRNCGGDELLFPADVEWDVEEQDWRVVSAEDQMPRCQSGCGKTTWARWVPDPRPRT